MGQSLKPLQRARDLPDVAIGLKGALARCQERLLSSGLGSLAGGHSLSFALPVLPLRFCAGQQWHRIDLWLQRVSLRIPFRSSTFVAAPPIYQVGRARGGNGLQLLHFMEGRHHTLVDFGAAGRRRPAVAGSAIGRALFVKSSSNGYRLWFWLVRGIGWTANRASGFPFFVDPSRAFSLLSFWTWAGSAGRDCGRVAPVGFQRRCIRFVMPLRVGGPGGGDRLELEYRRRYAGCSVLADSAVLYRGFRRRCGCDAKAKPSIILHCRLGVDLSFNLGGR